MKTTSNKSSNSKSTKKQIGKVESNSKPGTFHKQFRDSKGRVSCSCIGFQTKKRCHHVAKYDKKVAASLKASSAAKSSSLAAPKGNTCRTVMISLLLRNKGKVVSISTLKAAIKKARGYSEEKITRRIKAKTPEVAKWAKVHGVKFLASKSGLKLVA